MKISTADAPLDWDVDLLVVGVFSDEPLSGTAREINDAAAGLLDRLKEREAFVGKALELSAIYEPQGLKAPELLLVGLGKRSEFTAKTAFRAAGAAARRGAERSRNRVGFSLVEDLSDELTEAGVCGAVVGCVGQDLHRKERKRHPFPDIVWHGDNEEVVSQALTIGDSVNLVRRLVNEPANRIYPESFADEAAAVAEESGLEVEVWDRARLTEERCGALLAVSSGASRAPRLVILRHQGGADPKTPPLALVGKGVTFDSGGLSLKPSDSMKTMKCDMAGAATVLGAMRVIGMLKLPVNVVGLVGLVENMTGPAAYKLGDVLQSRNGKTIEVLNTDAEGRLVLADVLSVTVDMGASRIVDLATLTGACVVALGLDVAGLMTNDSAWLNVITEAAERCGEPAWELPMFSEFGEQIKSEIADIKNIGEGRWGGAMTAAKFLEEFVDDVPWTHIDIAGPSFLDSDKPWQDGGGTGAFVRTLVETVRRVASES